MRIIYLRKLHYEEAKNILLSEIEKSFLSGEKEVEVVHGIGTYTIRNMILKEIEKISYVEFSRFKSDAVIVLKIDSPPEHILKKYL